MSEDETIRWPRNLNRKEIETRLAQVRESARTNNLPRVASLLADLEGKAGAQIGPKVVAALDFLQGMPEHAAIAKELQMVALNLKNLR